MRRPELAGRRAQLAATALIAAVAALTAGHLSLPAGSDAGSPLPGTAAGAVVCPDAAGDRRDVATDAAPERLVAGTDLRAVLLEADDERLAVRFVASDPLPVAPDGVAADVLPVQWVLWLMDGQEVAYQLRAVLRADGWQLIRDDLRDVPVVTGRPPDIDGPELAWDVELAHLPRLPDEFGWVGLTTYGAPPVQDVCPDAANDSLAPDVQLRFPGGP